MSYSIERQQKLQQRLQDWDKEKPLLIAEQDLQQDIKETKNRINNNEMKKKLTTSKFLTLFLFISCSIIEIFTMYAIIKGMNMGYGIDFTPLTMLISAMVTQTVSFSIYSLKAMKENTQGGIVYETTMLNNLYPNEEEQELTDDEICG